MRTLAAVVFSALLFAFSAHARAAGCPVAAPAGLTNPGHLTFGTTNPPPAPGITPINLQGFEYELSVALAQTMCLKPAYTVLGFAGLFPGLDAHKFDVAIAGIGITPARSKSFSFVPYFLGGIRLMVQKKSGLFFKDERAVCGHSIAVLAGSVEAHDIAKYQPLCPAGQRMTVRILPSNNEIVEQLRKGTVQVAFLDWAPIADIVKRNGNDFAIGSPILTGEPPGQPRHRDGLMLRLGDTAMQQALAAALTHLEADGAYGKLLTRWGLEEGDIRKAS